MKPNNLIRRLSPWFVGLLAIPFGTVSAQNISSVARRDYPIFFGGESVAVGDFNRDGSEDLAVADGAGLLRPG